MPDRASEAIDSFIAKQSASGGHERGAGQQFLLEFCDLLGLAKPDPPQPEHALNAYTFERRVDRHKPDGSVVPNWIDLYKAGHFVLETKQGVNPHRDKSSPDCPLSPGGPPLGSQPILLPLAPKMPSFTSGPDPDALAARFGRRTNARLAQIDEILDTLRSLGKL